MAEGRVSPDIDPVEVEGQIGRMVDAGVLARGSRAVALLEYLVHHWSHAGPDAPLKAYAIAVDVLGRGKEFNPATDSIVRVEIGRLRKVLESHFAGPGRDDPVLLSIPRGQITLAVQRRVAARDTAQVGTEAPGPTQPPPPQPAPARARRRVPAMLSLGIGLGLAIGALIILLRPEPVQPPPVLPMVAMAPCGKQGHHSDMCAAHKMEAPVVVVAPVHQVVSLPGHDYLASGLENQLVSDLSHYRTLRVRTTPPGQSLPQGDFLVRAAIAGADGRIDFTATLHQSRDETVLWSGQFALSPDDPEFADRFQAQVRAIAAQVAAPAGVVPAETRSQAAVWAESVPSDFLCYLHWQSYDLTKSPGEETAARECLGRLTAENTRNGAVWAAHAFLLFLDWTRSGNPPDDPTLDAALAAASKAIALDPTGSDGHETQGSILLARNQPQEALLAMQKAIYYNPSNPDLLVKVGWQTCLAGNWEQGVSQVREGIAQVAVVPGWHRIPLALDAYRQRKAGAALEQAQLMIASGDRRGVVLALAAALMAGDAGLADRYRADLRSAGLTASAALAEIRAVFPDPTLMAAYAQALAGED